MKEKKLSDYLHLYLGCEFKIQYISDRFKAHTISKPNDVRILTPTILYLIQEGDIVIKPILRRLSSMTEEEAIEFDILIPWTSTLTGKRSWNSVRFPSRHLPEVFKKGFWLFGDDWFDEGLIIDKATVK